MDCTLKPLPDKVEAITKAPAPKSVVQLQAYLGLLNYYGKFLPRLSDCLTPLHQLLKKDVPFEWTNNCEIAFQNSKKLLVDNQLLVHYDCSKDLYLSTDASEYGVGAVLSHQIDGKPISFASSTLNRAQRNYSQVEKEALAIIFAIKKFHKFLYGRKFTIISDHQPLMFIFDPLKKIPITANGRLQRWALLLSGYTYDIVYRKGILLANADALSRLPLPTIAEVDDTVNYLRFTDDSPLDFRDIAQATRVDPILSKVYEYVVSGWPNTVSDINLKPYFIKRAELGIEQKCVLWGSRVIIPFKLRNQVLSSFHESHNGIVQSKMLMREYCWWPNLGDDIEKLIAGCEICQASRSFTNSCSLMSWKTTKINFERVHVDFFYLESVTYLLIVDAHSKWLDVHIMKSTTATNVIEKLCQTFSIIGIPASLVSDNGPPFNSREFVNFLRANGCEALKTPPYHAQSNGLAERTVCTNKSSLSRLQKGKSKLSKEVLLHNFLFTYRNTPNSTGMTPNEMLFKYKPRTRFELLKPHNVISKKSCIGSRGLIVAFQVGDQVWCKELSQGKGWIKGIVTEKLSDIRYIVRINGFDKHYHASSLRACLSSNVEFPMDMPVTPERMIGGESSLEPIVHDSESLTEETVMPGGEISNENNGQVNTRKNDNGVSMGSSADSVPVSPAPIVNKRPTRMRKPPDRLNL